MTNSRKSFDRISHQIYSISTNCRIDSEKDKERANRVDNMQSEREVAVEYRANTLNLKISIGQ